MQPEHSYRLHYPGDLRDTDLHGFAMVRTSEGFGRILVEVSETSTPWMDAWGSPLRVAGVAYHPDTDTSTLFLAHNNPRVRPLGADLA